MFHLSRLRCIFLLGVPSFFPPFKVLKAEFRNQACQPFHQTNTWEESWKSCSFSQDPTVPLILYHYLYVYIYCKTIFHFGHHCATSISPHQSSHRVCFSDSWVTSIVVAFISMLLSSNVTWPKSYQFPTLSTCRGPGSSVCPSVSWNFQVFLSALSVRLW